MITWHYYLLLEEKIKILYCLNDNANWTLSFQTQMSLSGCIFYCTSKSWQLEQINVLSCLENDLWINSLWSYIGTI